MGEEAVVLVGQGGLGLGEEAPGEEELMAPLHTDLGRTSCTGPSMEGILDEALSAEVDLEWVRRLCTISYP